jgi:hypothetical protein
MTSKPPPVPPASKSKKGTGSAPSSGRSDLPAEPERENVDGQGQYANTKQNTTVQGNHGKRER